MPTYIYTPSFWNGVDLSASPYTGVVFDVRQGPGQGQRYGIVEAPVVQRGDRRVREQPKGSNFLMHVGFLANTEANLDTFHQDFNPQLGSKFLEFDDGDSVRWRVAAVIEFTDRVDGGNFVVMYRVADPVFETSVEVNLSELAKTGDSFTFSRTNAGSRRTRMTRIELRVDTDKTKDPANDFVSTHRGALYNRTKRYWRGPVHVTFGSGDPGTIWNTAANVIDVTFDGTLVFGIDDGSTLIDVTQGTGGGLPSGPGMFRVNAEQIYYADNAKGGGGGGSDRLTGCIRGIGGTANVAHSITDLCQHSWQLKDGNDIRVFLNGREVACALGDMDTADTRLWINDLVMPPGVPVTLSEDWTASVPANGGEAFFDEGVADLPDRGRMMIENEVIGWTGRNVAQGKITGIARSLEGGQSAQPHVDGTVGYLLFATVVVGYGRVFGSVNGATPNLAPGRLAGERPAINLIDSDNAHWEYGTASDPLSVPWDPTTPNRPATFRPDFEIPEADKMASRPHNLAASSAIVAFDMSKPKHLFIPANRIVLDLPQGIRVAANAIEWDVIRRRHTRLRLLVQDAQGVEVEAEDDHSETEGASINHQYTPLARIHRVIFAAVRAATAGQYGESGEASITAADTTSFWQRIVIDNDMLSEAIMIKMRENSAGDAMTFHLKLWNNLSGLPNPGADGASIIAQVLTAGGNPPDIETTLTWEKFDWSGGAVFLPAGTYWLEFQGGAGAGTLYVAIGPTQTSADHFQTGEAAGAGTSAIAMLFQLLHLGGGPVNEGLNVWDDISDGKDAGITEIEFDLDNAAADPQTPFVNVTGSPNAPPPAGGQQHIIGQLLNLTTSQEIDFDAWVSRIGTTTGSFVRVDLEEGTVRIIAAASGFELEAGGVMIPVDSVSDPMYLDPGVNDFRYDEKDMGGFDIETRFPSKRE